MKVLDGLLDGEIYNCFKSRKLMKHRQSFEHLEIEGGDVVSGLEKGAMTQEKQLPKLERMPLHLPLSGWSIPEMRLFNQVCISYIA